MKSILILILILFLLAGLILWIFSPPTIPYLENLWELMGRPALGANLGYLVGVLLVLFFLSAKILKSGSM